MDERCTRDSLPLTAAFFDKVYAETRPIILDANANWNRQCPYTYNANLRPVVEKPATTSYPSGHAFASSVCAVLMTSDWGKEARLGRWSRLCGGAHYPNDVIVGKVLGGYAANALLQSPQVREALQGRLARRY